MVSGAIFPTTLYREKTICNCVMLLPMTRIEPGPPAQQASALSITPMPSITGAKTRSKGAQYNTCRIAITAPQLRNRNYGAELFAAGPYGPSERK